MRAPTAEPAASPHHRRRCRGGLHGRPCRTAVLHAPSPSAPCRGGLHIRPSTPAISHACPVIPAVRLGRIYNAPLRRGNQRTPAGIGTRFRAGIKPAPTKGPEAGGCRGGLHGRPCRTAVLHAPSPSAPCRGGLHIRPSTSAISYAGPVIPAVRLGRIYNAPLRRQNHRTPAEIGTRFRAGIKPAPTKGPKPGGVGAAFMAARAAPPCCMHHRRAHPVGADCISARARLRFPMQAQ